METEPKKRTGHPVFLVLALLTMIGAVLTYHFEDNMVSQFSDTVGRSSSALTFALSLVLLVLLTLFFVWCYRSPALGDKILGRNQGLPPEETPGFKYGGGGFNPESAGHEKKLNTQRKSARALRKQMAARQREIEAEKAKSEDEA